MPTYRYYCNSCDEMTEDFILPMPKNGPPETSKCGVCGMDAEYRISAPVLRQELHMGDNQGDNIHWQTGIKYHNVRDLEEKAIAQGFEPCDSSILRTSPSKNVQEYRDRLKGNSKNTGSISKDEQIDIRSS